MLANNLQVAVVGASLGGLGVANVLHRLGARVEVFDYFPHGFHNRGGALGAVDVNLVQEICGERGGHMPHQIRGHGHFYGNLWQTFYEGLPEGTVHFGIDVQGILQPESDTPQLLIEGSHRPFDLIIGADGGKSTIRPYVTHKLPQYAGYTLWRGLVPTQGIAGPPSGSKTIAGVIYETLGFPFVGYKGETLWNCGVYMAMPESEVEAPTRNRQVGTSAMKTVPAWFVPFVRALFGDDNANFWQACSEQGKVSPHAVWEFAADRVVNGRIMLLGDAAHMASPRTGAGAYTAMMDAVMLGDSLQRGKTLNEALQIYNDNTVQRGEQLFQRSRQAASYFAPGGKTLISPTALLKTMETQMSFNFNRVKTAS